ncbi:Protein vip1 [Grifola frondosa]|uniref:Protein vip1 n=1 Tax=Grifola frondosa TaxID=5627 RepID=A0A1C7M4S6_GRIFR|nr:Protein vip1 [Grifola frondosa]
MTTYTVHVSNLSPTTTEQHISDFFTFCGKIESIDFSSDKHTATINFEKPSAAKTALMLNGGTLDGAHLIITSDTVHPDHDEGQAKDVPYEQSDKPRAGIAAEYLARGYTLSDQILERAIDIDQKHGISSRFLSYIQNLDSTIGAKALGPEKTISGKVQETLASATQQARAVDEQKGISKQAGDYYSRALASPFGQKVFSFYTTTSKQIHDIHEEARRIADTHKAAASGAPGAASPPTVPAPGSAGAGITGAEVKTTEAPTVV